MTFDTRPPRCSLVNVVTGESIECLFNPTQLVEKVQVNWNRLAVPGLSHQVLQYQSTGNRELSGVEFYLDRVFAAEQPGDVDIMEFRAFLRALTVPPEATEGVAATAPPRTLFIWPGVLTVEAVHLWGKDRIGQYDCVVSRDGARIARGPLTVYEPSDEELLQVGMHGGSP